MKVKELIEKLKSFDENLEVGGSGHFGELLEIYDVDLSTMNYLDSNRNPLPKFVAISMEGAGDEPD